MRTRQTNVDIEMQDVADVEQKRLWAIYGRAGTGKTTLASSFPKPILIIDVRDRGTDSIKDIEDIKVTKVETWEEFEDIYWWLKRNPKAFKTVVIDTITQLQQIVVEEVGDAKASKKGKQAGDWGTLTKGDWGDIANRLKVWISNYKDLPMEVVFIAQMRVFNVDEEDSVDGDIAPEAGPRLSPSVMAHLCASASIIGNTFIRSRTERTKVNGKTKQKEVIEYCIRLGPSSSYITKIRKPKSVDLPSAVVDPTYEEVLEIIEGE